jgi:hypothetical protein
MSFLGDIERNVRNKRLLDDISKLSQGITASIAELSDKAQKLNELTDQYKQSLSEIETDSNTGEKAESKPSGIKGFFSSIFGSSENKVSTTTPLSDANSPAAVDNIDADSLSEASTLQPESSKQAIEQPGISSDNNPNAPPTSSDMFSSSLTQPPSPPLSPLPSQPPLESAPPSPPLPPALLPESVADDEQTVSSEQQDQQDQQQDQQQNQQQQIQNNNNNLGNLDDSSTTSVGGKSRKKSKRSKKTIRKNHKKSKNATKTQKNDNSDVISDGHELSKSLL